jgi:hypothetical protein
MKSIELKVKMNTAGYGYRSCATMIRKETGANIHFTDVYNFVNRKHEKLGRLTKKTIRVFFISKGWIAAPKKRQAPVCRRCGLKYPTRKFTKKNSVHKHIPPTK